MPAMPTGTETLIVVPVDLYKDSGKGAKSFGLAGCAIVCTQTDALPKFQLLCYNEQQETLCVSTVTSNNELSVQFTLQESDFATFRDDDAAPWSLVFTRSSDVDKFCATFALAVYGAASKPSHTPVTCDITEGKPGKVVLAGDRAKVRYSAWSFTRGEGRTTAPELQALLDSNSDMAYTFSPPQSVHGLSSDMRGFESCVLGMAEEGKRCIVVPATCPRGQPADSQAYANMDIVYVTHLLRKSSNKEGASSGESAGAVVPASEFDVWKQQRSRHRDVGALQIAAGRNSNTGAPVEPVARPGSGVPPEHMIGINKTTTDLSAVLSSAKSIFQKVENFEEEWKIVNNRPKPSRMTNQQLEHYIKQLIMKEEKARDEVARRDDLIKSLEERNRTLQRRVDQAALSAQQLMDEKRTLVTQASDKKIEIDRQVLKLQEEISRVTSDRDDVYRHLQTVKQLLEVQDNDNRETKSKVQVVDVSMQNLSTKLEAADDTLADERTRRKALEKKSINLSEELRETRATVRDTDAQLNDLQRKIDADRVYYSQLMEDERQRAALEASQLRDDIMTDLNQREKRFQQEKARVSEDSQARGRDEGMEIGRTDAKIEAEARIQELSLQVQRAQNEVGSFKTNVRETQEAAMRQLKLLTDDADKSTARTEELTRAVSNKEYELQLLRKKMKSAEEDLINALTRISYRLVRPTSSADLITILSTIRKGEMVDYTFQTARHREDVERAAEERAEWVLNHLLRLYQRAQHEEYKKEELEFAYRELHDTVAELRGNMDLEHQQAMLQSQLTHLIEAETVERAAVEQEERVAASDIDAPVVQPSSPIAPPSTPSHFFTTPAPLVAPPSTPSNFFQNPPTPVVPPCSPAFMGHPTHPSLALLLAAPHQRSLQILLRSVVPDRKLAFPRLTFPSCGSSLVLAQQQSSPHSYLRRLSDTADLSHNSLRLLAPDTLEVSTSLVVSTPPDRVRPAPATASGTHGTSTGRKHLRRLSDTAGAHHGNLALLHTPPLQSNAAEPSDVTSLPTLDTVAAPMDQANDGAASGSPKQSSSPAIQSLPSPKSASPKNKNKKKGKHSPQQHAADPTPAAETQEVAPAAPQPAAQERPTLKPRPKPKAKQAASLFDDGSGEEPSPKAGKQRKPAPKPKGKGRRRVDSSDESDGGKQNTRKPGGKKPALFDSDSN